MKPVLTPAVLADGVADIGAASENTYIVKKDGTLWRCGMVTAKAADGTDEYKADPALTQITQVYRYFDGAVN